MYLNGKGIPKNITKAIELYTLAAEKKSCTALTNLLDIYEEGKEVPKDLDKACHCCYLLIELSDNKKYSQKLSRIILLSRTVNWRPEYHKYWKYEMGLNKSIVYLLLVSKFKKESTFEQTKTFIKGIMMKIIQFLCHIKQIN
jgi:TPR repeat protein